MVMSCQAWLAWPPWQVPSPLELAFEVTFQSLAKEVDLRTRGCGESRDLTSKPKASQEFLHKLPLPGRKIGLCEESDTLLLLP